MTHPAGTPRAAFALAALAILAAACGRDEADRPAAAAAPAPAALHDVAVPDLSRVDESVRQQVRERFAALEAREREGGTAGADLGRTYGELGMLLHAAEYYDAAEPAYLNAQLLEPSEPRWPYYLGHLYKSEGDSAKAIASFARALELQPNDVPTLIWLGRMYLEQGTPDKAEPLFSRAASIPPRSVAAVAGLGQTALARRDYPRAVELLEEALAIDPRAASIHAPLAQAYRGLGDLARAGTHATQWRNTELPMLDPLIEALDVTLQSGLSYELQGVAALNAGDYRKAEELFRKGVEMTPGTNSLGRSLRHKLGTALALSGDVEDAIRWFEETVRLAPEDDLDEPAAKAHYSLGILMASNGRTADAIEHLRESVRYNPNYVEARVALADVLRGAGRLEAALAEYAETVRISPTMTQARFGYAMALVKLGRYVEARDWLDQSLRVQPNSPELAHALARVLAAAPDPRARDGQRAAALGRELFAAHKRADVAETLAMALAETGQFAEAVAMQRELLELARRDGTERDVRRVTANLRLYEQRRPSRTPWPADDPVHFPGPQGQPAS